MTYEQFWHYDPNLLTVYQKAYYNRIHEEAHLYGQYNFIALSTALSNAFRKQGTKPQKYIDKPNIDKYFKKPITQENIDEEYKKGLNYQIDWVNALSNNK